MLYALDTGAIEAVNYNDNIYIHIASNNETCLIYTLLMLLFGSTSSTEPNYNEVALRCVVY